MSATETQKQELGSTWIIRRAIRDNVRYNRWEDIVQDKKFNELLDIYPEVDDDWLQAYFAQHKKMLDIYAGAKFTEFTRDGGFMDFITNLVTKKIQFVSQKDAWNPADIWLVQNELSVIREITDKIDGTAPSQTINELNAILKRLFNERRVVGISLKKVSGKQARYEELNVGKVDLNEDLSYKVGDAIIDLSFNETGFGNMETRIEVLAKHSNYSYRIMNVTPGKFGNLKFEPTARGAAAARLGQAPVKLVNDLLAHKGFKRFVNNHNKYPKDIKSFLKLEKSYRMLYRNVATYAKTFIKSDDDFVANIIDGFDNKKTMYTATSKLMQLTFLYDLSKLSKKNQSELMTDLIFLAEKRGAGFGPFGKLY